MAYVRRPDPSPYFLGKVATYENGQVNDTEIVSPNVHTENNMIRSPDTTIPTVATNQSDRPVVRRSSRTRKAPDRFGVKVDIDHVLSDESVPDKSSFYKIKRVLGQRSLNANKQYLIQFSGEPAENALWVPLSNLNEKLKKAVQANPPPVIVQME